MLQYSSFDIVFQEIPDETTLAINLTGCPNRCKGCHSPHLQENIGKMLTKHILHELVGCYGQTVTCICFMGGDQLPSEVESMALFLRKEAPSLKIGWYSGRSELPPIVSVDAFDYIKLGPWIEQLGGLKSKTTNQRFYEVRSGKLIEAMSRFQS